MVNKEFDWDLIKSAKGFKRKEMIKLPSSSIGTKEFDDAFLKNLGLVPKRKR